MFLTLSLASITVLFTIIYYYLTWNYDYWKKRNVKFVKPVPFFGNYFNAILSRRYYAAEVTEKASQFPNEKVVGMFLGTRPVLYIRDTELIKDVTVKDFWYFADRVVNFEKEGKPEPLDTHLFAARHEIWKVLRKFYTPLFSTASLKKIFHIIEEACNQFEKYMTRLANKEIDLLDETSKLTLEIIGPTVFGLQINNINDDVNVFREMAHKLFLRNKITVFAYFYRTSMPRLIKLLQLKSRDGESASYFRKLTEKGLEIRRSQNEERNDFVDIAIKLQNKGVLEDQVVDVATNSTKNVRIPVTFDMLAAQSFVFLAAGFETSASAMALTLYELAKNPALQRRAQKEIDDALKDKKEKLTYDTLMGLTYLNMCLSESMRMYPAVGAIFRICDSKYTFKDINVTIDPGVMVLLPAQDLHYDPKYFPNPNVYDPERFSPENKDKINPYAYLAFGVGYRNCIGLRLGVMQTLMGLVTFLKNYNIETTERTPKKIIVSPMSTVVSVPGVPIYLRIVPRE